MSKQTFELTTDYNKISAFNQNTWLEQALSQHAAEQLKFSCINVKETQVSGVIWGESPW